MTLPTVLASLALCAPAQSAPTAPANLARTAAAKVQMMRLPLSFEANRGQFDPRVRYMTRTGGATVFLTNNEAVMVLPARTAVGHTWSSNRGGIGPTNVADADALSGGASLTQSGPGAVLRMKVLGARKAIPVTGLKKLAGITNYFIGNNPKNWRTNIPTYRQVRYAGIYPGTDLVYYGNPQRLEYDFVLKPGADPEQIRLAFSGADRLHVAANGDLIATTSVGDVALKRPFAYQEIAGRRVQVACDYAIAPGTRRVSFRLARYDSARPLVVDPSLAYCTYLGGNYWDTAYQVAVDPAGCAYLCSRTVSTDFPTTAGAVDRISGGGIDTAVTKLTADGAGILYSTYLGGSLDDGGCRLAVDDAGAAYVSGWTSSSDFPVVTPYQRYLRGTRDAFVAKLNPNGSALAYSTYFGGSGDDGGQSLAIDTAGAAYVAGYTYSVDLPLRGPFQSALYGSQDGFVLKLAPGGSSLAYASYLGGSSADIVRGIAVDPSGCAYLTGQTSSTDFPVPYGACQTIPGAYSGFAAKVSSSGSRILYGTYIGGSLGAVTWAVAVDQYGCAYIAGASASLDFPTPGGAYTTYRGGDYDTVVVKLGASGSSFEYGTYLEGSAADACPAIAVDSAGRAWVSGTTNSADFPVSSGAQLGPQGDYDAYIAQLSPDGGRVLYSARMGGTGLDWVESLALGRDGSIYICGDTQSADFPTTSHSFTQASFQDAFVARFELIRSTRLDVPAVAGVIGQTVGLSATLVAVGGGVAGKTISFTVDGMAAGSATTNSGGTAGVQWSIPAGLGTGAKSIYASFAGDENYSAATGTSALTVSKSPTALEVPSLSGNVDANVSLSATLYRTSDGAVLGGKSVAFSVEGAAVGSATTDGAGTATLVYRIPAALGIGSKSISAAYAGNALYLEGSGTGTLTVGSPETTLTVPDVTAAVCATITLKATLTRSFDGAGLSGRTIAFVIAGANVGTATTDGSGIAALSYSVPDTLGLGRFELKASFAGEAAANAASRVAALTITQAPSAITVPSASGAPGGSATLAALLRRATDGGVLAGRTVTFQVDGVVVGSAQTSSSGVASVTYPVLESYGIGTRTIRAAYAGETLYQGSIGTGTLTISRANASLSVAARSGAVGETVTLGAVLKRATDGAPLGGRTVTFSISLSSATATGVTAADGTVTAALVVPDSTSAATRTITASFAGDTLHLPGSGSGTLTVTRVASTLTASASTGAVGGQANLTAALKRASDGAALAGRTISFTVAGARVGTAVTGSDGIAAFAFAIPETLGLGAKATGAEFAGDAAYTAAAPATSTLTVSQAGSALAVPAASGAPGGKATLSAVLTRDSDGGVLAGRTVEFQVDGVVAGSAQTTSNGVASVTYPILESYGIGTRTIRAAYAGETLYQGSIGTGTLTISRANTTLTVAARAAAVGETVTLGAALKRATDGVPLAGRTVTFSISPSSATATGVTAADGTVTAALVVPDSTSAATRTITASFAGDTLHLPGSGSGTLTVTRVASTLTTSASTGAVGGQANLTAALKRASDGAALAGRTISFTVAGARVGTAVTGSDGIAAFAFAIPETLGLGAKATGAEFAGDAAYTAAAPATSTLTVSQAGSALTVPDRSGAVGATVALQATLTRTTDGAKLGSRTVTFTVGGVAAGSAVTNSSGIAARSFVVTEAVGAGARPINATFAGDTLHLSGAGTGTLTVSQVGTTLTVPTASGTVGAAVALQATLSRATDGVKLGGRTITFTAGGVAAGSAVTNASGVASLSFVITEAVGSGARPVSANFAGDGFHLPGAGAGTLNVAKANTTLAVPGGSGLIGSSVTLTATLRRVGDSAALSGRAVTFSVAGVAAGSATTNASGVASAAFTIPATMPPGAQTIRAEFAGDTVYNASAGTAALTVRKPAWIYVDPRTKAICDRTSLAGTLFGTDGSVKLTGKTLTFFIDGVVVGSAVTQSAPNLGAAILTYTVPESIGVGTHTITATFAGDAEFAACSGTGTLTVTPAATVLTGSNVTTAPNASTTLTAVLARLDGLMSGKAIRFKVDGTIVGQATTGADGRATLTYATPATLTLGGHAILAEFSGDTANLAASAANTMTVIEGSWIYIDSKTAAIFTKPNLSAQLRTTDANRALVGKTIAFQLDGRAIGTATTTATPTNGAAWIMAFPITEAIMPGAHTLTAVFAGDAEAMGSVGTATLTVTKGTTYMTVYDNSVIRAGSVMLRATLSCNGGFVPAKTLTFSVDGVAAGTAVTNSEGIAAFTYNAPTGLLPGAHAVTVTFAADATCLGASGKATLTVTKENASLFVSDRTVAIYDKPNLGAQLKGLPAGRALIGKTITFRIDDTVVGTAITTSSPVNGGAFLIAFPITDTLTPGTHTLGAAFAGDTETLPATGSGVLTITRANSSLSIAAAAVAASKTTTLTADLASNGGPASGRTITFRVDGAVVGTATASAAGRASLNYTAALTVGAHTLRAEFAGDTILNASSGTATLTVTP